MKGRRIAPEGMERKVTHLPPGLKVTHSRRYGLDSGCPSVLERTLTALRPSAGFTYKLHKL
jgi:hypothetical protein